VHIFSLFKFKVISVLVVLAAFISGCAGPGHYIKESDVSLTETRRNLVKLFGEPRLMSQNGREFTTTYMDKKGRILETVKKANERRFAHITILGERRPYDILVNVVVEQKLDGNAYDAVDSDEELSENLAKSIKGELLKSLENRNIIDDFNAF
jgi:hypothetical protein